MMLGCFTKLPPSVGSVSSSVLPVGAFGTVVVKEKLAPVSNGGVNVDQVDFAGQFGHQAGQDVFFVAPDEPVPPFSLGFRGREQTLAGFNGFVDGFDSLKRQGEPDGGGFAAIGRVFTLPVKFGHVRGWGWLV